MFDVKKAPIYTRDKDTGELVVCQITMQEVRLARGYMFKLGELLRGAKQSNGWQSRAKSKLFGRMEYRARYKGRCWWHSLRFSDEVQAFHYEEMRHALQGAIYGLTGEVAALNLSFDKQTAEWRLLGGARMVNKRTTHEARGGK